MSKTVTIESAEQALNLLQQQVNKKGFTYRYTTADEGKSCRYIEPDENGGFQPGCIVGHILLDLGYEPSFCEEDDGCDDMFDGNIEDTAASGLTSQGVIEAPEIVGIILSAAQAAQDQGQTWGQALAQARTVHEAYKLGQRQPA